MCFRINADTAVHGTTIISLHNNKRRGESAIERGTTREEALEREGDRGVGNNTVFSLSYVCSVM